MTKAKLGLIVTTRGIESVTVLAYDALIRREGVKFQQEIQEEIEKFDEAIREKLNKRAEVVKNNARRTC